MFIYREEYYDKESEREGEADILIAKHRNGALGDVGRPRCRHSRDCRRAR